MNWTTTILHTAAPDINLWEEYYSRIEEKGIYHSPHYIRCLEKHYQDKAELFIFGNEQEFIYYPYFIRQLDKLPFASACDIDLSIYFDIVSSWYYGGPLVSGKRVGRLLLNEVTKAFSAYSHQQRFVSEFIRFDPNIRNHLYFVNSLPISENRKSVYVDLRLTEEQIWDNVEGRARTAIRKAKKLGVQVHISNEVKDIVKFSKIYAAEMERKKAPKHYLFGEPFVGELFNTLAGKIKLIWAGVDDIFISGGIFVYDMDETVHYYLMATNYDYFQYQANNLILYEAMLYFKKKGARIFDLQGGREGVYNFKKSFSKTWTIFYTCGVIHDISIYEHLVRCSKQFSRVVKDGFFPAYRQKSTN
jgi:hypothetical protein